MLAQVEKLRAAQSSGSKAKGGRGRGGYDSEEDEEDSLLVHELREQIAELERKNEALQKAVRRKTRTHAPTHTLTMLRLPSCTLAVSSARLSTTHACFITLGLDPALPLGAVFSPAFRFMSFDAC